MQHLLDEEFFKITDSFFEKIEPYLKKLKEHQHENIKNEEIIEYSREREKEIRERINLKTKEFDEIYNNMNETKSFIGFIDCISGMLKEHVEYSVGKLQSIKSSINAQVRSIIKNNKMPKNLFYETKNLFVNENLSELTPWKIEDENKHKTFENKTIQPENEYEKEEEKNVNKIEKGEEKIEKNNFKNKRNDFKQERNTEGNEKIVEVPETSDDDMCDDDDLLTKKLPVLKKWTRTTYHKVLFNSEKDIFNSKEFFRYLHNKNKIVVMLFDEVNVFGLYFNDHVQLNRWNYDQNHFVFNFARSGNVIQRFYKPEKQAGINVQSFTNKYLLEFGNEKDGKICVPSLGQNIVIDNIEGIYKGISNNTLCDDDFKLKQIVVIQLYSPHKKNYYNNNNESK